MFGGRSRQADGEAIARHGAVDVAGLAPQFRLNRREEGERSSAGRLAMASRAASPGSAPSRREIATARFIATTGEAVDHHAIRLAAILIAQQEQRALGIDARGAAMAGCAKSMSS